MGRDGRARSPTTSCGSSPRSARIGSWREVVAERFGGAADAVALSGGYGVQQDIPPDLIQDLQRIPGAFIGFSSPW